MIISRKCPAKLLFELLSKSGTEEVWEVTKALFKAARRHDKNYRFNTSKKSALVDVILSVQHELKEKHAGNGPSSWRYPLLEEVLQLFASYRLLHVATHTLYNKFPKLFEALIATLPGAYVELRRTER